MPSRCVRSVMNRCQTTRQSNNAKSGVARCLAPEEIAVGDFVAVLRVVYEVPSFVWNDCDTFADRGELVRLAMIPEESSEPLKVKAVCLPFVLVKSRKGQQRGLDIRRFHLARVDSFYARAAWKASKSKTAKSSRKRK
jgi:hypothetical protein